MYFMFSYQFIKPILNAKLINPSLANTSVKPNQIELIDYGKLQS